MSAPELIELANEYAHIKAEVRALTRVFKEAIAASIVSEKKLKAAMTKRGIERFELDDYRHVVWIEDTDEIVIVEK